jgi:transcriptional regulator with PAS, ATPase and Fis domain
MRKEIQGQYTFHDIISKNHEILNILTALPDIAESGSTVLLQGPSGSGKELFARAIHNISANKNGRYIAVNCGALPDTLLESELFGYVKGAFTDAKKDKPGRFALAEGGTLFLDEIGDISTALQIKLLRALQEGEYEPLGSTKPVKSNTRIIAATNKNLKEQLALGRFRDDLYYRLNIIKIELPTLAKRREDIPLLVEHFINRFNLKKGRKVTGVSQDVMEALMVYDFPGNIRELENIIEYGFVLCRDFVITLDCLPLDFRNTIHKTGRGEAQTSNPLRQAEAGVVKKALEKHKGHRGKTAEELGIDKSTLWRKMKKFGIMIN